MKVGLTVFTKTEFMERVKRCKQRMIEKDVEVLFVTDPANIHWLDLPV